MNNACEIKPGVRVEFMNGDTDPEPGIVNGQPWVFFDGVDAVARVPVMSLASGKCIDVAGHNIFRVRLDPDGYSVRA
jgi:hypothetical protein